MASAHLPPPLTNAQTCAPSQPFCTVHPSIRTPSTISHRCLAPSTQNQAMVARFMGMHHSPCKHMNACTHPTSGSGNTSSRSRSNSTDSGSSTSTALLPLFINLSFYLVIMSRHKRHQPSHGISPLLSIVNSSNSNFNNNFNTFNNSYTVGITDTMGFVRYRTIYRSVSVGTWHKYGVCGYGYGVGKPDPRYTRVQP